MGGPALDVRGADDAVLAFAGEHGGQFPRVHSQRGPGWQCPPVRGEDVIDEGHARGVRLLHGCELVPAMPVDVQQAGSGPRTFPEPVERHERGRRVGWATWLRTGGAALSLWVGAGLPQVPSY